MTALTRFFFPEVTRHTSTMEIVRWWESRRLAYNGVVGAAGLISVAAFTLFGLLPPHPAKLSFTGIVTASMVYGVLANVCYTAGSLVEATITRLWDDRVLPVGPVLFRHGVIFSIGLTLFPTLVSALMWATRIAIWIVR